MTPRKPKALPALRIPQRSCDRHAEPNLHSSLVKL